MLEDDGPGFTQEQLQRLANAETPSGYSSDGFGLGLCIVQDIVRAHNGQLHIDQSPLGGARIRVAL